MAHVTSPVPYHQVAISLALGTLSANSQLSNLKGNPNPTLLSLLSTGALSLGGLNSGNTYNGFGGA
jgi:hypothetical protein